MTLIRSALMAVTAGALVASTVAGMPAATGADLPEPGDKCEQEDFWEEITVKNTQKDPSKPPKFVQVKYTPKGDTLTCVPVGWNPELDVEKLAFVGQWVLRAWPRRVSWYPERFKPDPDHDPCRATRENFNKKQTLSSYDRSSLGYVRSVGRVTGLIVSVSTQQNYDRLMGGNDEEVLRDLWFENSNVLAEYAEDFYWNESRGRLKLNMRVDDQVHIVNRSVLPPNPRDITGSTLIEALDSVVDFSGVDFVVFQLPADGDTRVAAFPAKDQIEVDGTIIQNSHGLARWTRGNLEARSKFTLIHEIGHLLGLPDLYAEVADFDNSYGNRFALEQVSAMESMVTSEFSGFERWVLGWMPTKSLRCVLPGDVWSKSVGMSPVESEDSFGLKMIMFPVEGTEDRVRVVEMRDAPNQWIGPYLLTYEVNTSSSSARYAGHPDCNEARRRACVAPITAYRDDWTTLDRRPEPDGGGFEALAAYSDEMYQIYRQGAYEEPRRRPGDSPNTWLNPTLTLNDLEINETRYGPRARLTYGLDE